MAHIISMFLTSIISCLLVFPILKIEWTHDSQLHIIWFAIELTCFVIQGFFSSRRLLADPESMEPVSSPLTPLPGDGGQANSTKGLGPKLSKVQAVKKNIRQVCYLYCVFAQFTLVSCNDKRKRCQVFSITPLFCIWKILIRNLATFFQEMLCSWLNILVSPFNAMRILLLSRILHFHWNTYGLLSILLVDIYDCIIVQRR